jgi:hypothetical protein
MANRVWYNLRIDTKGTEHNNRSIFIDLISSFDEPKEAFLLHSELNGSISDWSTSEYVDWPTIDEDMREFSLKYPGVEFEFTCDDQDGSYWREWYKDGLAAYAESHIVHSEIEESMYF